jgi:lipopolysaccharide/colanic/teichoic acid biosynthesis glycosyltransferase
MDPFTLGAVLLAVITGTSEALGGQLWAEVESLVRRPPRRKAAAGTDAAVAAPSGEAELVALQQTPADQQKAVALAERLLARAAADAEFDRALKAWWEQAEPVRARIQTTNTISGGTLHGPVLMGQNFSGITFGATAAPLASSSPHESDAERGHGKRLAPLLLALALSVGVPAIVVSTFQILRRNPLITIIAVSLYELALIAIILISQVSSELQARWSRRAADAFDSWLSRKLSRFIRAYLSYVKAFTRYMDVKGLSTVGQHILEMKDILISLSLSSISLHRLSSDPVRRHSEERDNSRENIWYWITEAQKSKTLLAIIGPPGSGKTTLLRHVAFVLAAGGKYARSVRAPSKIPVLINLREHSSWPPDSSLGVASLVRSCLTAVNRPEPPSWVEANLRHGKFAILLDGLDEIPEQRARIAVTEWLRHQASAQAGNLFILTSRPFGYRENPIDGAMVVEVQPLAERQISAFVHQWYVAASVRSYGASNHSSLIAAATGSAELLARLDQAPSLFELTANPLLLTMLVNVHYYRGALPGTRAELYDEISDVFLAKRDQARGVRIEIPGPRKRVVLQALAYEMISRKMTAVKSNEASHLIESALSTIEQRIEPAEFLQLIEESAGLLVQKERGVYSFAHLTFQEYLCAEFVKENGRLDEVMANLRNSWWQESIRLFAAISDATPLVNACLSQHDDEELIILGLQCAEEAKALAEEARLAVNAFLDPADARDDISIRRLTARARLLMRLNKDIVLQRGSFFGKPYITWLEYQHFIDSQTNGSSVVPDHWHEGVYPLGADNHPAVGMRYDDAAKFCKWIETELGSSFKFRLPILDEIERVREGIGAERTSQPLAFWTSTQQSHSRDGRFSPLLRFQEEGDRKDVYPYTICLPVQSDYETHISDDLERFRSRAAVNYTVGNNGQSLSSDSSIDISAQVKLIRNLLDQSWPKLSATDAGQTERDIKLAATLFEHYIRTSGQASGQQRMAQSQLANHTNELAQIASVVFDRQRYGDRKSSGMMSLRETGRLTALMASAECIKLYVYHGGPLPFPARKVVTKPTRKLPDPSRSPTARMYVLAHAFVDIYADLLILDRRIAGQVAPSETVSYVREVSATPIIAQPNAIESQGTAAYPRRWLKGAFDITAALLALLLLSPLLLAVAITIRLEDGGPAFFRQVRIGKDGKPFRVYKFRTMVVDAEQQKARLLAANEGQGVIFKIRDDPRITRIGSKLRRWSLDELPQLINVLLGEMSFVGPRPALPQEAAAYTDIVRRRLAVKPGITGLWQIHGRSDLPWEEAVRLDLQYIEDCSFKLDLFILLKTWSALTRGLGAY